MPTPEALLRRRQQTLRKAGLSNAKVEFLRDLAQRIKDGRLDLDRLRELSDEDVVAELIEVKGVGRWTAEMFLIFHLARPDVVSVGDLGIRRAVQIAYGMDDLPGPEELERIADEWRTAPHAGLPLSLALAGQHSDVADSFSPKARLEGSAGIPEQEREI